MRLTYKLTFKPNKTTSSILSSLTYASARLFNVGNYERHEYEKLGFEKMPNWYDQKKRLKDNYWFKSLPSQTSQDILQRVDEGWKSYFKLLKTKGIEKPNAPFYKKHDSHYNIKYLNNSFKVMDDNRIRFMISKKEREFLKEKKSIEVKYFYLKLDKKLNNIKTIEFKYVSDKEYEVYIVYEDNISNKETIKNNNYISIDLGICNLATIYDNKGKAFIISGNSYLNTLYYYNKRIAHYQSIIDLQRKDKKGSSKRIKRLYTKKNRKIEYILHAATRKIVDYCVNNDVSTVIIGNIKGIRENTNLGKENNQKLHSLPFEKLYSKLKYKLQREGINLIYQLEYYTSSCPIHSLVVSKEYASKGRIKRGLFKEDNNVYNADCVGAFNIMRLYKQNNGIEIPLSINGLSNPNKISICVTS